MSTAPQIGTIASKTDKLLVQRQGEQLTLRQGDAILAGDVIQNKDLVAVDIELPGQAAGQADSLVTLAPESAAQIATSSGAEGGVIEVTSLTEGVELFAVSEGTDGAVLLADAGTGFSGLVGAGLLSAGSAGGVSGIATAIGGGVGVAALAASSGDDTNVQGSAFTDVRVDNGDETTEPVDDTENPDESENPDDSENPEDPENPEEPQEPTDPVDEGTTGTPLDAVLDPLADALGGTPLSVISDPLFDALGSLPIGSAPNPADSLPLDAVTGNLLI
ncbi:MAG: hypothetical protein A0129_02280 [Limnobacter sp. CACIAM 66H1]|uniref:hypothetical protein n=1 Tax=Limnobacter sp. CACIAM 66H1 TaxID=1813033 RepID=UPI0007A90EAA|nr:hypothetical protein [Limnobacter sp. CACIAM 66H1]KYP12547.1 MAG: hypothetical protein A0129_02280 [Limnobacter sp. CACIAM 66H1]